MEVIVAVSPPATTAAGSLRCYPPHLHSRRSVLRGSLSPVFLPFRSHPWLPRLVAMAKPNWSCHTPHRVPGVLSKALHDASKVMLASGAAALVLLHSASASAVAETFTITFPGSQIGEVNAVQRTLVEAWGIVRETYVDPSFNNQDWDLKLQEVLGETLSLKTSEAAYSKIRTMLATLGDPFTRIVSPQEYASFRINNEGALEGVGLLIGSDRDSGRLVVLSPIEGGPAQRAGILTGDELVQIDDVALAGMNNEDVATRLRGRAGTSVTLKVRRARNGPTVSTAAELTEITLQRETILLSPVYSAVIHHVSPSGQEIKTGYVRLSAFSQNAAVDMEKAVSELEESGVDSYILDLRNNPGGLVKAGLDVAQMWLDGNETLVNTIDRNGFTQPINLVNGHALTRDPLVVLVNEGSASASEILAGALHDNGRAVLVGTKTYGKGKIQSVTELRDGSALFVTVAKYLSPALHQIDHVGIAPDVKCSPDEVLPISMSGGGASTQVPTLDSDSCIITAEHQLDLH
ncbi:hypothetical protein KC19_4G269400 [Ceratodon purpureus]|uniref:C-terminal processing peptidase n=1 Tax=Ceratodon purpureus TaxID=3225 RepID=A0A8T0IF68_CERPU|nr:hypothetical protein KC19_4G269400 [Ceratodon purpureus]